MQKVILGILALCAASQALDSGDNKFMKDYAMLKIYESCFGTALLKQITKELKDAYAKCSTAPPIRDSMNSHIPPILLNKLPPGFSMDPNTQIITKPTDGANNNNQENDLPDQDPPPQSQKPTIFAFRPQGAPFAPPAISPMMMGGGPQLRPYNSPPLYPFQPYGGYQGYQGFPGPYSPYYPQFQGVQGLQGLQGLQGMQGMQGLQGMQGGFYQQPYIGSNRVSRQVSLRTRLGLNIPRMPSSHNVTCVMQELGYIDHNLEPNYEQITQRIENLPVSNELKGDIQEGLQFCQKFSQCVPEDKRDIVSRPQEQIKAIFFFRCYKHKKLEACIMKDINEHFTKDYVVDTEADFGTFSRSGRSARDLPMRDPSVEALEEMEVYLYDYLSGGGAFDFDLYI